MKMVNVATIYIHIFQVTLLLSFQVMNIFMVLVLVNNVEQF